MTAKVIDGKQISDKLREKLKAEVEAFKRQTNITPGLAVILVGEDPASKVYVKNKAAASEQAGIKSFVYNLPKDTLQGDLIELISALNEDANVHGILVQLPLPKHLDEGAVIGSVSYHKDVDGFHPINAGNLFLGKDGLFPCTPTGCIKLIESVTDTVEGKHAVVIGRSNIVGKPLAVMLLEKSATVTVCHSRTKNLKEICLSADILCCAVGRPNFVTADMIKRGAIVIDVGINRVHGTLTGDVDYQTATDIAGSITPVPGGVGPMTITMLLYNTLKAARKICGN